MNSSLKHWVGVLFAAIPYFTLSLVLFLVWHDPMSIEQGSWVPYGVGLLAMEFLLLHSGAFFSHFAYQAELKKKLKVMAGFLAMYSLMAWGMAKSVDSLSLLYLFGSVTLGRLISVFTLSDEGKETMMKRSGIGTLFYLLVVFGTVFIPIPEWGITRSIVNEVYPNRGGGLWESDPHRAIAGAAIYFLIMGIVEIRVFGFGKPNKTRITN